MDAKLKTSFGLIVGTRNIFNSDLAKQARKDLLSKLDTLGYDYVILPEDQTPSGSIESYQDAKKCAEYFIKNQDKIDGIIIVLPNFGDELGIINTLKKAALDVPVLVQACDDENDKVDVHSRRDAFCGKVSVCNNLYQYGIPFTNTKYHTYNLNSKHFEEDLDRFSRICRVVRGLRNARVGAIGTRPAAFQTMRSSEKLLQDSGITVVPVDMSEIIAAANAMDDNTGEVKQKIKDIKEYGNIPSRIKEEKIVKQTKFGLAVEKWIEENDIDVAAIQCWDTLEKNYGCAACVTMSMLGEKLIPCGCENDITGTLSMYALALAAGTPSALLDWNNNFGEDRNMCVCTHCSNYPKSFFQNDIEISSLDVLGTVLGHEDTFGAVKGKVNPGDMTFFRISTDDRYGIIKAYTGEGNITDDTYKMDGGIAVCRVNNLQPLMNYICKEGFEHHVSMVRSNVAKILEEAVGNYLGWELYLHE